MGIRLYRGCSSRSNYQDESRGSYCLLNKEQAWWHEVPGVP